MNEIGALNRYVVDVFCTMARQSVFFFTSFCFFGASSFRAWLSMYRSVNICFNTIQVEFAHVYIA